MHADVADTETEKHSQNASEIKEKSGMFIFLSRSRTMSLQWNKPTLCLGTGIVNFSQHGKQIFFYELIKSHVYQSRFLLNRPAFQATEYFIRHRPIQSSPMFNAIVTMTLSQHDAVMRPSEIVLDNSQGDASKDPKLEQQIDHCEATDSKDLTLFSAPSFLPEESDVEENLKFSRKSQTNRFFRTCLAPLIMIIGIFFYDDLLWKVGMMIQSHNKSSIVVVERYFYNHTDAITSIISFDGLLLNNGLLSNVVFDDLGGRKEFETSVRPEIHGEDGKDETTPEAKLKYVENVEEKIQKNEEDADNMLHFNKVLMNESNLQHSVEPIQHPRYSYWNIFIEDKTDPNVNDQTNGANQLSKIQCTVDIFPPIMASKSTFDDLVGGDVDDIICFPAQDTMKRAINQLQSQKTMLDCGWNDFLSPEHCPVPADNVGFANGTSQEKLITECDIVARGLHLQKLEEDASKASEMNWASNNIQTLVSTVERTNQCSGQHDLKCEAGFVEESSVHVLSQDNVLGQRREIDNEEHKREGEFMSKMQARIMKIIGKKRKKSDHNETANGCAEQSCAEAEE